MTTCDSCVKGEFGVHKKLLYAVFLAIFINGAFNWVGTSAAEKSIQNHKLKSAVTDTRQDNQIKNIGDDVRDIKSSVKDLGAKLDLILRKID